MKNPIANLSFKPDAFDLMHFGNCLKISSRGNYWVCVTSVGGLHVVLCDKNRAILKRRDLDPNGSDLEKSLYDFLSESFDYLQGVDEEVAVHWAKLIDESQKAIDTSMRIMI